MKLFPGMNQADTNRLIELYQEVTDAVPHLPDECLHADVALTWLLNSLEATDRQRWGRMVSIMFDNAQQEDREFVLFNDMNYAQFHNKIIHPLVHIFFSLGLIVGQRTEETIILDDPEVELTEEQVAAIVKHFESFSPPPDDLVEALQASGLKVTVLDVADDEELRSAFYYGQIGDDDPSVEAAE